MFALELDKASATLENLNPRMEKHGDEKVPACTLKFSTAKGAELLAYFSATLRAHLFETKADLAGEVLQVRYPHLDYPLSLNEEMTGARISIDYGVSKPMEFEDCKVDDFRITPKDGGSVILSFRVACKPDEKQIGKLYLMQEQAVTVTLAPAELPEMEKAA
jgi:hypothetical protein